MAENSKIEWTHHTFNPWVGCTRVSPACDHCYAESWAKRYGTVEWGAGKPRKITSKSNWQQPLKWNNEAKISGIRKRVFCASLADVFDNEVPSEWRDKLWLLIAQTPYLDWLLLTKRIGNAEKMFPSGWGSVGLPNVWLGISVINQAESDRDIPKLLDTPARVRFLSMEPLLAPVNLTKFISPHEEKLPTLDWIIVGGESGIDSRPMHPDWALDLRDQCNEFGVPFLFKQWGNWYPAYDASGRNYDRHTIEYPWGADDPGMINVGKLIAGRLLDGQEENGYPIGN